jgi:hypothetical protein
MKPNTKNAVYQSTLFALTLALALAACTRPSTPTPSTGRGFALVWYVATTGSDSNSCSTNADPCRSLNEVINRTSREDARLLAEYTDVLEISHTVYVGAGTFQYVGVSYATHALTIANQVEILGAGRDATIIDAEDLRAGVYLRASADVEIRNLTIRNGTDAGAGNCLSLRDDATAELENVTIEHCDRSGIAHYSSGPLSLTNVIIRDAVENGIAGANDAALTVSNSQVVDNGHYGITGRNVSITDTTVSGNGYGGLSLGGSVSIVGSTITNNGYPATAYGFKAGLSMSGGTASISETTFSNHPQEGVYVYGAGTSIDLGNVLIENNEGVGLNIDGGTATLDSVTVQGNGLIFADTSIPGGIQLQEGMLDIRNSIVRANYNGGVRTSSGTVLTMRGTTVDSNMNDEPGLWNNGMATIEASTFSNNHEGIQNRGTMTVTNSTASGNRERGILGVGGDLSLSFVTIANNGIIGLNAFEGSSDVRAVSNVLIANNGVEDCEISSRVGVVGPSASGYNIDSDDTCLFGDGSETSLLIGPLANNGGATLTHALLDGSPAIDAATGACVSSDQRGVGRPVGGACDVGAYEKSFEITSVTPLAGELPEQPAINTDTPCWQGPGSQYPFVANLVAGAQVNLLGLAQTGSWFIVQTDISPGDPCWVDMGKVDVGPDFDFSTLIVYAIPPLATPPGDGGGGQPPSGPPVAPSGLAANTTVCNGGYQVTVSWKDNSTNEQGFRVYRKGPLQNDIYHLIATLGPNITQYVDNPPGSGPYTYYVEAFNASGAAQSNSDQDAGCLI